MFGFGIFLIMIERTNVGVHAGQISFPGGKCESDDTDNICTSIRETAEEIGIKVDRNDVIGELPPVKVPVSKFEIFPVVAFMDGIENFTISECEVKKVLEVDIENLYKSLGNNEVTIAEEKYDVPSFVCEDSVVWGASAMILDRKSVV